MVNINKLKGKIVECELSVTDLARRIGIDRATLYRKINSDGKNFTIEEADLISKELMLTSEEVTQFFLVNMSHK